MAAALAASENPNVQVVLLERQARVGRKLQATGNGRCNLSNRQVGAEHYHGQDASFCVHAISTFDVDATLSWFSRLGLCTITEDCGRIYPYSDQANSVVDVLRLGLERPNISLRLGFEVIKIKNSPQGFAVCSEEETVLCDKLIVACGGIAGSKLGGTLSGYKLLGKLGHKCTKLRPNLVQLQSNWQGLPSLKGVRANCRVEIRKNGNLHAHSTGELQFTELGLSGPVIYEVSRDACTDSENWEAVVDFLPQWEEAALSQELKRRTLGNFSVEDLLTGILHNRLGRVLTRAAGIKGNLFCKELNNGQLMDVCRCVKAFHIALTQPLGMDSAQVTAGGILTDGFDPTTMESKLVPGLFACGEVLDIDGDCGGYNLQWAWSSGYIAGINAGKDSK